MIVCGHYLLIKNIEKVNDTLYKGVLYKKSDRSLLWFNDIVYFNPTNIINIPHDKIDDLIAVKYSEVIYRDLREGEVNNVKKPTLVFGKNEFDGTEVKF